MSASIDKVTINTNIDSSLSFGYSSLVMPTCRLDATVAFLKKWPATIKAFPNAVHIVYDGLAENISQSYMLAIKSHSNKIHVHAWDALFIGEEYNESLLEVLPLSIQKLNEGGIKCFSTKDSSIRSYGFIVAAVYANFVSKFSINPDEHVIYTLDDDCLPIFDDKGNCDFFLKHAQNLLKFNPWSSTVPGIRVRGFPYYTFSNSDHSNIDVVMSMGMWKGIPDFDAVQRLGLGVNSDSVELPLIRESVLAHREVIHPICGMNLAFKVSMLPAALFAPMGTASKYKRFDDIWFGLFAQAVLKLANKDWCYGQPLIYHDRLSAPLDCLVAETPGIKLNEVLWMYINDAVSNSLSSGQVLDNTSIMSAAKFVLKAMSSYKNMANDLPNYFAVYGSSCLEYAELWCECISNWINMLNTHVFSD